MNDVKERDDAHLMTKGAATRHGFACRGRPSGTARMSQTVLHILMTAKFNKFRRPASANSETKKLTQPSQIRALRLALLPSGGLRSNVCCTAEAEAEADALIGGSGNDSDMSDGDDDADEGGGGEPPDGKAAVKRAKAVAAAMKAEAKAGTSSGAATGQQR